jgi:hypothetical protein
MVELKSVDVLIVALVEGGGSVLSQRSQSALKVCGPSNRMGSLHVAGGDGQTPVGLIRLNRARSYTREELAHIAEFNHRLVERVLPEIHEFIEVFDAKPKNVVVFEMPSDMANEYNVLAERYSN